MQKSETFELQEKLFKYKPCPVCGSKNSETLYPIDKAYAAYHSGIDLSAIRLGVASCKE